MVEPCMQIEILPYRELAVEGEGLRHVAHVATRLHVIGTHGLPEQLLRTFGYGQQLRHHFHCCRFSAAVRAEETENLAAADMKADVVNRNEIAKAAGQPVRLDGRGTVVAGGARAHDHLLMLRALFRWKKGDEGVVQCGLFGLRENLPRRAM